jgi:uncharacterized lipoprotein YajG
LIDIIDVNPKSLLASIHDVTQSGTPHIIMKKYICILASAALLAACEQKTETATPAASPEATATTSPAEATTTETATVSPSPAP